MSPRHPTIEIARAYGLDNAGGDSFRVLVDRLWPRGVKKDALKLDRWMKEIAPSNELRQRFAHDPSKWSEFRRSYRAELANRTGEIDDLLTAADGQPILLIYAAKDEEHNNAVVLKEYLQDRWP